MSSSQGPQYRVLVYGVEVRGIAVPHCGIMSQKCAIEFGAYNSAPRFQDFDGVIVLQRTFESYKWITNNFHSYWDHNCDRDELDKRTKEAVALLGQGGFLCLLLTDPFIDEDHVRTFYDTDLSKRFLAHFDRKDFGKRTPIVNSQVDELRRFFDLFGAANASLSSRTADTSATRTLALANQRVVSVMDHGKLFAIPTLIPQAERTEEFFTVLGDSIVALWERFKDELPDWAREYRFPQEAKLLQTKQGLSAEISDIETQLARFERLKRVLALKDDLLVEAVMEVFSQALPLKPNRQEAFREDFTLSDTAGNMVALVEVKGVNKGVTREHVNQADSHRERQEMSRDFPSLLIVNTNMKNAKSLADKDQTVPPEQVEHAAKMNVLILRTLDLLNLACLHMRGDLSAEEVVDLLTSSRGWLKVDDAARVLSG